MTCEPMFRSVQVEANDDRSGRPVWMRSVDRRRYQCRDVGLS